MSGPPDAPDARDALARPHAGVVASVVDGWRRTLDAPGLLVGVTILAFMFPPALTRFVAGGGAGPTFGDSVGVISTPFLSTRVGGTLLPTVVWLFVWGGILDRLARGRRVGASAFFAACGGYWFRFLRLAIGWDLPVWFLLVWTGRLSSPAAMLTIALSSLSGVITDFARVRAVVEDRRSMLGALAASWRFIRRRPLRIAGLYLLTLIPKALVVAFFIQFNPIGATSELAAASELFAIFLVWGAARLATVGAEIAFFQGDLAHAHYTAAPLPVWPDSPAVEAIRNLGQR